MGETDGGAAEACLLSQWPVWAVVAFPLQPADEAVRIGPTAIGQLARGVVVFLLREYLLRFFCVFEYSPRAELEASI